MTCGPEGVKRCRPPRHTVGRTLTPFGRVWYGAFDMFGVAVTSFVAGQTRRVPAFGRYWWWFGSNAEGAAV